MRTARPLSLLMIALLTATTFAAADERSWLDNTLATCRQTYDETRCSDPEFLEQTYHVNSLQVAHKASMRGRQEEQRALRELTLQRLCGQSVAKSCAGESDGLCAQQMTQMCADIRQRADNCVAYARQFCAQNSESGCLARQSAFCPSAKKQDINALLAKYPKLSNDQRNRLAVVAQQLDKSNRGLIGSLFRWLGF